MTTYLSPGIYTKESDFSYYVKQLSTSSAAMVGVAERGPINQPMLVTSWEQFVTTYGGYIQAGYLAYAARSFYDNGGSVLYVNRVAHLSDPLDRHSLTAVSASVRLQDRSQVAATLVTGQEGTDQIRWTAHTRGTQGNGITVALIVSGNDTPASVSVSSSDITVNLATDISGSAISTADQIVALVRADAAASELVSAATADTGITSAVATTQLAGGLDGRDSLLVIAANEGTWGNDLSVSVIDSSREPGSLFNLIVRRQDRVLEIHRDLSMDERSPNHVELKVNGQSSFISVSDLNESDGAPTQRPMLGTALLSGGNDGLTGMTDHDFIGDASAHTGLYAFDEVDALNLIAVPGVTTAPVIQAGLAYAENRRDLMFLADAPIHMEPLEVIQWRRGEGSNNHAAFNSTYGALYYPWQEISDPLTGQPKLIPKTASALGCYARSDRTNHVWSAPAGVVRGRLYNVLSLAYKVARGEMDALYPEGINCSIALPETGIAIMGQRTLTLQSSALDRVNVRRLMMHIQKAIKNSSWFVVFEPNNPLTWRSLIRLINPFLQDIQENGGLYAYRVQCDEETNTTAVIDRNQMVCRVFVKPTKTAEFIEVNFVLTSTGADFTEIYSAAGGR